MIDRHEAWAQARGWRKIVSGIWFYDGIVPRPITIWAKPASDSSTRYDDDDQLDPARPIPVTKDGFLYCSVPGHGEFLTVEEAKANADAQPWGPVKWDE
ncbi:MAG: hypothetical protein AB1508_00050 [Pseudomonadota bacterium]